MDRHFNVKAANIHQSTNLEDFYINNITEKTLQKISDFQLNGSGWALCGIDGLMVNNCKNESFNGSSYMKLPKSISNKKATINVQNHDNKCFLWSILAAIHYKEFKRNFERVTNYQRYENDLNMNSISYPVSLDQIDRFEKQNENISVNVYAYKSKRNKASEESTLKFFPIRLTEKIKEAHVHLLLTTQIDNTEDFDDDGDINNSAVDCNADISDEIKSSEIIRHYCYIKDLSRLLQRQLLVNNRKKKFYCDRCLNYFYSNEKQRNHLKICFALNNTRITLPTKEEKLLEFKNFGKQLQVPFVVYADTEAVLKPITECDENELKNNIKGAYQRHIPHSIGYYLHSYYPHLIESRYEKFTKTSEEPDCITWFAKQLKSIGQNCFQS